MNVKWQWFGIEVHGESIYFITRVHENETYYLASRNIYTGTREWSKNPRRAIIFSCKRDAEKYYNRFIGTSNSITIRSACA